jgi:hypothetical protein
LRISFETEELLRLVETERLAVELIGASGARVLQQRLRELRAVEVVADFPRKWLKLHEVDGDERMHVHLGERAELVFVANHRTTPVSECGHFVDWTRVKSILLLKVGIRE